MTAKSKPNPPPPPTPAVARVFRCRAYQLPAVRVVLGPGGSADDARLEYCRRLGLHHSRAAAVAAEDVTDGS